MINKKIIIVFMLVFCMMFTQTIYAQTNTQIIRDAEIDIFAVSPSKVAMSAILHIQIIDGNGKIFSSINQTVGQSTLESERNAVSVAEMIVPEAKDKYNYLFHIESPATSIDGPSAGAAIAFLLINMLQGKEVNNTSITGTITQDGYVGDVSGVYEKSQQASKEGIKLFIVPKGNKNQVISTEEGESKLVDLIDYAYKEWGLKIVEVSTIEDILRLGDTPIEEIDVYTIETTNVQEFVPEQIEYSTALEPMRDIVDEYYEKARQKITEVEEKLPNSLTNDLAVMQNLLFLIERAKIQIDDAQTYSENNYFYTSANSSFIGLIYARTVEEIIENPSILSKDSTIFNTKINRLQKEIKETETRTNDCSYSNLEWCIGARQRVVWAENKINELKDSSLTDVVSNVLEYNYAYSWNEIANDFLDASNIDNEQPFIEFDYFEEKAEKQIIEIENKLVGADLSIIQDIDLQRRLSAAKTSLDKEWYITSMYDSATVLAIIEARENVTEEEFNETFFNKEYEEYSKILRSEEGLLNNQNVWSKLFFDHSFYYYKSSEYYADDQVTRQQGDLTTAYDIILFSKYLYGVEKQVLDFYENIGDDLDSYIVDIEDFDSYVEEVEEDVKIKPIYIYKTEEEIKEKSNAMLFLYLIVGGLFLMVVAIVFDLEVIKSKKHKILYQISEIDKYMLEKKISQKTYTEMKHKLLTELDEIKSKKKKTNNSLFYEDTPKPVKIIKNKPSKRKTTKKTTKK
jgi:uncharacterized protein